MKTIVRGGYVVGFDGTEHEIIRNGVVVFENDRIVQVGKSYDVAEGTKFLKDYKKLWDELAAG